MILCVIPMKDGHVLRPEVYKSLAMQSEEIAIMPITRPVLDIEIEEKNNKNFKSKSNYLSQAENRNIAKKLLENYEGKYVLYHTSDAVLSRYNAVEEGINILDKNENIGVIYFNLTGGLLPIDFYEVKHPDLASVLIRKKILNHILFRSESITSCNCIPFKEDVKKLGWKMQFLSNEIHGNKTIRYDVGDFYG